MKSTSARSPAAASASRLPSGVFAVGTAGARLAPRTPSRARSFGPVGRCSPKASYTSCTQLCVVGSTTCVGPVGLATCTLAPPVEVAEGAGAWTTVGEGEGDAAGAAGEVGEAGAEAPPLALGFDAV